MGRNLRMPLGVGVLTRPIFPYRAVWRWPLFPHSNGGMYLKRTSSILYNTAAVNVTWRCVSTVWVMISSTHTHTHTGDGRWVLTLCRLFKLLTRPNVQVLYPVLEDFYFFYLAVLSKGVRLVDMFGPWGSRLLKPLLTQTYQMTHCTVCGFDKKVICLISNERA